MSFLPGLPGPHQLFTGSGNWGDKILKAHGLYNINDTSDFLGVHSPFPEIPENPSPAPTIDSEAVQAAADAERRRQRRARGRGATMLTSAAGVTSSAPTGTATLLGR